MKTANQKRAKVGGEYGANGEWYEGGKFINTVPENDKRHGSKPRGVRKQEVAPYQWEPRPEGKTSIYAIFAGVFGRIENGQMVVTCSDQTLAYYRTSREEAQSLADKYNAGERWV